MYNRYRNLEDEPPACIAAPEARDADARAAGDAEMAQDSSMWLFICFAGAVIGITSGS